jgi:hypothetical protein
MSATGPGLLAGHQAFPLKLKGDLGGGGVMFQFKRDNAARLARRLGLFDKETIREFRNYAPPDMYTGLEFSPYPIAFGVVVDKNNAKDVAQRMRKLKERLKPYTKYSRKPYWKDELLVQRENAEAEEQEGAEEDMNKAAQEVVAPAETAEQRRKRLLDLVFERILKFEGTLPTKRTEQNRLQNNVYYDTRNVPTTFHGIRVTPEYDKWLRARGIGGVARSTADDALPYARRLFEDYYKRAEKDYPHVEHRDKVVPGLAEMYYQMGPAKVYTPSNYDKIVDPKIKKPGFPEFWKAVRKKDWGKMYREALDSKWRREDSPARAQNVADTWLRVAQ